MTITQWQLAREAAERYQRILVPAILGPAACALVEWSALRGGETVLDVGCGTGAVTFLAAERVGSIGRVVGLDVNAGMIEVARTLAPAAGAAIEWREESAYAIPFAAEEFDVVFCAQTLQFLDDRLRALAEMRRVLRPGGRVALSLWCDLRESPYFRALVGAIEHHIGPGTALGLAAAFNLSDLGAIRTLLSAAGFGEATAAIEELHLELPEIREFVPRHVSATPLAASFRAAPERARQAVVGEVAERLAPYETGKGIRVPFSTHLVRAALPA
jgi:ubiquinone/menaquinone biosynthesis C-methylase UbiE